MGTQEVTKDRVKLALAFDVQQLQAEAAKLCSGPFEYYNVIQLRGPAHMIDPSLPIPPPADDYADGSWTNWLNAPQLKEAPYLTQLIAQFNEHTQVTLVRLLRLAPGNAVAEHKDPTLGLEVEKSVIRLTIPIQNDLEVRFLLNGSEVPMGLGECWYLRLTDPHEVLNHGKNERINLSIDMVPNAWVRALIAQGE